MRLLLSLLVVAATSAAADEQTFTGTVNDDVCARNGHAAMRMGPNDAECTRLCVMLHGSDYVLVDGKTVYLLSDQKAPEKFAGQAVRVTGTLDAASKTIKVTSIAAAR